MSEQIDHLIAFGGTFDPPHEGHLALVKAAQNEFPKAIVEIIPNCSAPKVGTVEKISSASFADRLAMCRLVFESLAYVNVSDLEMNLPAPNYTLNTLVKLRDQFAPKRLSFLMGSDQLEVFEKWHQPAKILEIADLLVVQRDKSDLANLVSKLVNKFKVDAKRIQILRDTLSPAASHLIRNLKNPLAMTWLDPLVRQYIQDHHLYATERGQ